MTVSTRTDSGWRLLCLSLLLLSVERPLAAQPDLTGVYDVGTLTPLERPEAYGDRLYLTPEEAAELEERMQKRLAFADRDSDPQRAAPAVGGNIGGYNNFWLDRGETANAVDGRFRTSIISSPPDGRLPPMNAQGERRMQAMLDVWRIVWRSPDPTVARDNGSPWWLELPGPAPYDNVEQRSLAERCIVGSRSTAGPPMLPNIYNNHKRIVQTDTHVVILSEMNHDARLVRLDGEHESPAVRRWLGDSIGHWNGDTLVIETRHFGATPALSGADENLTVREELSRQENGALLYRFTVTDPTVWTEPWSGEYSWRVTDDKVYEYACHEGNYALGNILRGARLLEREAAGNQAH